MLMCANSVARPMSTHVTDQERLDALALLPGFRSKSAIATALLACYNPEEFGALDRRALEGLRRIERLIARGRGETRRYLDRVRDDSSAVYEPRTAQSNSDA